MQTKTVLTRILPLAVIFLCMIALPEIVNCKRILVLTPSPLYSHQSVFRSLCLALHRRGHELVVVTALPMNTTFSNYTEIDISLIRTKIKFNQFAVLRLTHPREYIEQITWYMIDTINHETFENPQLRQLYAPESNEKFDMVIAEAILGPALYSFAHRFRAPLIGVASMETYKYVRYLIGDLLLPSHPSHWEFHANAGFDLPFWKRVINYIDMLSYIYRWTYIYIPRQQEVVRKYLGSDAADLRVIKNMSLLLIGQPTVIKYAKPELPNVIYFNGLHITKEPPPLPKNLKQFLDGATEGFIYVSLGSTLKSCMMPKERRDMIVKAFSKLSYKILWKFEQEKLPGKPKNVFISQWVPQQGVLAHPNIKMFIYQGGVQSTDEAIHYAVPLVGIPVLYDQGYVVDNVVELGVAQRLEWDSFTDTDLLTAIFDILNNKRYKENMVRLNNISRDKQVNSTENVVWWIEYVMRHNGVPHLRFNGADQPLYERYDTDVIAFLTIVVFLIVMLLLFALAKCLYFIVRSRCALTDAIYKIYPIYANAKEKSS